MFNKQNFCHVASNNRNEKKAGIFVYKTTDDLATVSASGYFNDKIVDINLHDLIIHEWHDATDRTKVQKNVLCVTERTLDNVGTVVIKSKWEEDTDETIADLQEYVDETFVRKDGTSVMTAPLKFQSGSMRGAVGPYLNGVSFWKMDAEGNITNIANLSNTQFSPVTTDSIDLGSSTKKFKTLYLSNDANVGGKLFVATINNGYDIAVPVTSSADTLALKSQVDDAANSGEQLYTTGVWYAKMYAATVVPTGAEYDGRNYADFSQVDSDNNPIIVIYTGASGAWTETTRITPPANHNGYMTITSKIWDITEQSGQQGGLVLWSHNQKTFTPYPRIVSFDGANITNSTFQGSATLSGASTVTMPGTPTANNIANKGYVDTAISNMITTGIFQALYPVGSIYIGTQSTCPLATLIPNSTWTKVSGDKVLQTSSSSHSANSTISAGLPNIEGTFWAKTGNNNQGSGAFSNVQTISSQGWDGASDQTQYRFRASNSNSIYGNSSTVQPPAYVVNVWRRTA